MSGRALPAAAPPGARIRVRGLVQGVGFRPTVWRIARELGLDGYVRNDGEGVLIEAWGNPASIADLVSRLRTDSPPLARIDRIELTPVHRRARQPEGGGFRIVASQGGRPNTAVVPDAATCPACVRDTLDPYSRRFRYPFTNCTHCGPRLTIQRAIPYDRANTAMAAYTMCEACQAEYEDPSDRRFHAQPNACHACGPRAWLERSDGRAFCTESLSQLDDVDAACTLLQRGGIVAIKGLGGFHLACDATHAEAVAELRRRKHRFDKPFALMARDLEIVRRYCEVSEAEARLLRSPAAPIVILRARRGTDIAPGVAPRQATLGFMLPYTPLHHLLLRRMDRPVVMTSGNRSEEPQCTGNDEARERLGGIAEWLLLHDRDIVNRVDDSVVRVMDGAPRLLRRARGYAPSPLPLPPGFGEAPPVLALGGELKATFCLLQDGRAILSQHIGDLEDAATWADFRRALDLYATLFDHTPRALAVDLHPEYLSAKLGRARAAAQGLPLLEVQHHHAHICACLADNGWPLDGGAVLGVALDGLGYGEDGTFWGGEFLLADYAGFRRLGSLRPVGMPGGVQAIREPWRSCYAHIDAALGWTRYLRRHRELELTRFLESKPIEAIAALLRTGIRAPRTTSCGRMFDAVAAAVGICRERSRYEGQAAIELEAAAEAGLRGREGDARAYPFGILDGSGEGTTLLDPAPMWEALLEDLRLGTYAGVIAARFHRGLAGAVVDMVLRLTARDGGRAPDTVALTGGAFQNRILLELVAGRLREHGYRVLTHRHVPANDGGLSLGQAVSAAARMIIGRRG